MKGFTKINNELLFDSNLDPMAKIVYAGLSYYDRGRGCFCKRTTLARLLNVSIYQLRKALKVLEAEGYIVIHKRHHGLTDVIRRVEAEKPLSDENCNTSIRRRVKKEEEVVYKTEVLTETTKDTAQSLRPEAADTPPIDHEANKACQKRLQQLLTYAKWEKWFSDSWVIEEKRQEFILFVPKPYVADYIDRAFREKIEKELGKSLVILGASAKTFGKMEMG